MTFVVLEYLEPTSPANRRVWDFGAGPLIFEATKDEYQALVTRLGADQPLRVVPIAIATKAGLLSAPTEAILAAGGL